MKTISNYRHFLLIMICFTLLAFTDLSPLQARSGASVQGDTTYVIQLRKNTNPKVIEAGKKPLLAKYPDKTLLTQVQPPNYILSIGYFATEAEAEEFRKGLEKEYPGCAVVPYEKKK